MRISLSFIVRSIFVVSIKILLSASAFAQEGEFLKIETHKMENASISSSPLVFSPDENYIYSVNRDSNTISVTDVKARKLINLIRVGEEPRSIAISPNGKRLFVANSKSNSISVLKIKSNGIIKVINTIKTGSEPRSVLVTNDGSRVIVANYGQDTVSVYNAKTMENTSVLDLVNSNCGEDGKRFFPGGLALDVREKTLYISRMFSFVTKGGSQADDTGKSGIVCKVKFNESTDFSSALISKIELQSVNSGVIDRNGNETFAFPNQLGFIAIHKSKIYLPNIGASPTGPVFFKTTTQSFVSMIDKNNGKYIGSKNLHLGGADPEPGKEELYFSNPISIVFSGNTSYIAASGSDILVKMNVSDRGDLDFTVDENTTRYIDLNNPEESATSGLNAGKNPIGMLVDKRGKFIYTLNYISRNISIVNTYTDSVIGTIPIDSLPFPGTKEEELLVGAEMFYSARGNFVREPGMLGSSKNRLSDKGIQNCASCHNDGLTDGVVWQFASGPRKTLAVNGTFNPQNPNEHKIINASAIFDEVEDADFNTRNVSSGGPLSVAIKCAITSPNDSVQTGKADPDHGLILGNWTGFDLAPCILNPFLFPNSGRPQPFVQLPHSFVKVKALDALVEWQKHSIRSPNRPLTKLELILSNNFDTGGISEEKIISGRVAYVAAGCSQCHNGGMWTKAVKDFISPPLASEVATETGAVGVNINQYLHRFLVDIGSYNINVQGAGNYIDGYPPIGGLELDTNGLKAMGIDHNGDGKGNGYNIPSILGINSIPPYYHNGACEVLKCVLKDKNHTSNNQLTDYEIDVIDSFLKSIDDETPVF